MTRISSLLIANRGEIACRIIRTARGWEFAPSRSIPMPTQRALHVREADEAVLIGPSPGARKLSGGEKIIAAALATRRGGDPSRLRLPVGERGFRAGRDRCGAGLGRPAAASIRAMGLKDAAKKLMAEAGVPVTPGYMGETSRARRACRRGRQDRLSGADQGGRRRRRQGDAARSRLRAISQTRWSRASARRQVRSATITC
jgi:3-methylcrotonyl-CoA carboxylase alpha subunit